MHKSNDFYDFVFNLREVLELVFQWVLRTVSVNTHCLLGDVSLICMIDTLKTVGENASQVRKILLKYLSFFTFLVECEKTFYTDIFVSAQRL